MRSCACFPRLAYDSHDRFTAYKKQFLHISTSLSQEKSLFRKLLYTNAARVTQDNGSDVWKDSLVCPLFPRERTVFQSGGKFK